MNQNKEQICIRVINENIKNVMGNRALTMPLRKLNRDCRFKKMYFAYCDMTEGDLKKARNKKYNQKHKKYYQKKKHENMSKGGRY